MANTIGKLSCGWLSDRSCVNSLLVYNSYVFLSGITIFLMPFCHSYVLFVSVMSIYGVFNGFVSLEAIVLVEMFGKNTEQLTHTKVAFKYQVNNCSPIFTLHLRQL